LIIFTSTLHIKNWVLGHGWSIGVTHFHEDASGGIPFLNNSNIKTYATTLTNNFLSLENREKSSDEISNDTFELVKNTIEVFYLGAGHTQDNIVVWLP
jgi:glyoxylase-like metal-dependent hydrolase (beta-lactamase superfamily II)